MKWGYALPYVMLALSWMGIAHGGAFSWTGFICGYVLLPALEFLFPLRLRADFHMSRFFDAPVLISLPVMSLFLVHAAIIASSPTSLVGLLGMIVSAGTMAGILAINVGHELVHRQEKWQRALGVALLSLVNFAHYGILHVFGHHKNVGTFEDPATARFGENVYAFWIRHYTRGLVSSFQFESRRLAAKARPWYFNRVLLYWLLHAVSMTAVYFWLGPVALLFWLGQSLVAVCLLMDVDFIEHYGLVRDQGPDGRPLAVKAEHSWDTDSAWSNFLLFNLGLHSHHHLRANLSYPDLRPQTDAKRMPYGYTVMLLAALIPAWYRSLIHPRLSSEARPPDGTEG